VNRLWKIPIRVSMAAIQMFVALSVAVGAGQVERRADFERGVLPPRWTPAITDCPGAPPFFAHDYNATFIILRQSGCTNFEKPFLYLLLGSSKALLVDTGAPGADASGIVTDLVRRHSERQQRSTPLPLVVIHSHGHSDHTAADQAFSRKSDVRVIDARPEALAEFFTISRWPDEIAHYDLGDRLVDIIPIPGHQPASIAIYDRRTKVLLTGDTLYPGRLYVRDGPAFAASINRLVEFTATREVAHVLGAHIENSSTPYLDYPEGTTFQPEEHTLELGRSHLLELQDGLRQMSGQVQRRSFRDFTIWPVVR
jgi:glyoxylase-like metal-dependent hydrolase (beta-lactamase superfamily II)